MAGRMGGLASVADVPHRLCGGVIRAAGAFAARGRRRWPGCRLLPLVELTKTVKYWPCGPANGGCRPRHRWTHVQLINVLADLCLGQMLWKKHPRAGNNALRS